MIRENIFKRLNEIREEDSFKTQLMKMVFALGKITWVHNTISVLLTILIPIVFKFNILASIILVLVLVGDFFYAYICSEYSKELYTRRRISAETLIETSSLINSTRIYIENENNWRNKVFGKVSQIACEKIYRLFKELYHCETRVSVEYVFNKNNKKDKNKEKTFVKMAGRKSKNREAVKKAKPLETRKGYYSYGIFMKNGVEGDEKSAVSERELIVLRKDDIKESSKWNYNNQPDINYYIALPVSFYGEKEVRFVLQVDIVDEFTFGKESSDEDIRMFVEENISPFLNELSLAYVLNTSNKNKMIEV